LEMSDKSSPEITFRVLTIFPEIISCATKASILGKAIERGIIRIETVDIREHATGKHSVVDDYPYGGGPGMVMKAEPIVRAVHSLSMDKGTPLLLLSPQGEKFSHAMARDLASHRELTLICGRYEGIDDRVRNILPVQEVSIGDFILTGGEFAALAVIDAVSRIIPGVLGDDDSSSYESFADGLLEYPQYTRPPEFLGQEVPSVLLSGDHNRIALWRRRQALLHTWEKRPDLLETADLTKEDMEYLDFMKTRENDTDPDEKNKK
jgi:tRNA (guanine37-N1)-methyltransferase